MAKTVGILFSSSLPSLKCSQIYSKWDINMRIAPLVSSWAPVLWSHGFWVRFLKGSSPILQPKWPKSTIFTTTTSRCDKQTKLAVPKLDWRLFFSFVLVSMNIEITKNDQVHEFWAHEGGNIPPTLSVSNSPLKKHAFSSWGSLSKESSSKSCI